MIIRSSILSKYLIIFRVKFVISKEVISCRPASNMLEGLWTGRSSGQGKEFLKIMHDGGGWKIIWQMAETQSLVWFYVKCGASTSTGRNGRDACN